MQWLAILILSVLACVTYGVIHDQITARICVEYFTIGHPRVIPTEDPTVLGFVWGVIATWWVGVILGIPLATIARVGNGPKRTAVSLIPSMVILSGCVAILAVVAGTVGGIVASNGSVWLVGSLARDVPSDKHIPFLVDLWAHNASYLGGFVGGIILMIRVWQTRRDDTDETG